MKPFERTYSLEESGPTRLLVKAEDTRPWRNVIVYLDGNEVGSIATAAELVAGRDVPLHDGSVLTPASR